MKINIAIASTTHLDLHNHKMSKSALEWMASQINEKYIPLLIEHNREKLIGVNLYWEVFKLDDGEYALWVVQWRYESNIERKRFSPQKINNTTNKFSQYLNIEELLKLSKIY